MRIIKIICFGCGPLGRKYGQPSMKEIDLQKYDDQIVITGENGSGKTFLLRSIAYLWDAFTYWVNYNDILPFGNKSFLWFLDVDGFGMIVDYCGECFGLFMGDIHIFNIVKDKYSSIVWFSQCKEYDSDNHNYFSFLDLPKRDEENDSWIEITSPLIFVDKKINFLSNGILKAYRKTPILDEIISSVNSLIGNKIYFNGVDYCIAPGVSLSELSDGEQEILNIVWGVMHRIKTGAVVLIDWTGSHLHPSIFTSALAEIDGIVNKFNGQLIFSSNVYDVWSYYETMGMRINHLPIIEKY